MATLEMALAVVSIYDGIRSCFSGKTTTSPIKPHKPSKMHSQRGRKKHRSKVHYRSHRCCGGADWSVAQRVFRGYRSETNSITSCSALSLSEFEASTDYILQQHRSSQLCEANIQPTLTPADSRFELHDCLPGLTAALDQVQHQQKRLRLLRRRTLVENAREVIGIQCASWWSRYSPDLPALSMESSLDFLSSRLSPPEREESEPGAEVMVYIRNFVNKCRKIYKAAYTVISDAYPDLSPAMDLLDINELIPAVNSALIEYLLRLEELPESNSF
ncbi:uncharacterized protein [Drosophila pseudoobscura]|uniref:Uncharacterized protein isoform X1 n=2 Tax=Drosophila pseudoobscura pseudoobscura TaxID=46245 RepID=A0A6I8V3Q7_DROPS|nr:uncharacterized protein LOC6898000 isoform X1 [Drosophila pseudoobscura]